MTAAPTGDAPVEDWLKTLTTLLSVTLGGVLVWLGNYFSDRRKVKQEKRAAVRAAYADWLTAVTALCQQIEQLLDHIKRSHGLRTEFPTLHKESLEILGVTKETIRTFNVLYLINDCVLERSTQRLIMAQVTSAYKRLVGVSSFFAAYPDYTASYAKMIKWYANLPPTEAIPDDIRENVRIGKKEVQDGLREVTDLENEVKDLIEKTVKNVTVIMDKIEKSTEAMLLRLGGKI